MQVLSNTDSGDFWVNRFVIDTFGKDVQSNVIVYRNEFERLAASDFFPEKELFAVRERYQNNLHHKEISEKRNMSWMWSQRMIKSAQKRFAEHCKQTEILPDKGVHNLLPTHNPGEISHCVYRYTDLTDGIVKYIGISNTKGGLKNRIKQHLVQDEWAKRSEYAIHYLECQNKGECESLEGHLIAFYGTQNFYNKAKAGWGINSFIPDIPEYVWKQYGTEGYSFSNTIQTIEDYVSRQNYRKARNVTERLLKMLTTKIEEVE